MKWLASVATLLLACTPTRVETKREPGLIAAPTRPTSARQLPDSIDVDPATLVPKASLEFSLPQPERVTLKNGLVVYLMADRTMPLVLVRALAPVGNVDDPPEKVGLTSITTALLGEGGAGARGPDALDEWLESRAIDLSAGSGDETASVSLSARSEDLVEVIPVFADVLLRPKFDEQRFGVIVSRSLESIRRREDRPDGVAARALSKAVYGPTSLLGREATEATLKAISLGDVKKAWAASWGSATTRLIVTGDFDRTQVLGLLEKSFGGWKGGSAPKRVWPAPEPLRRRIIVVPRKIAQAKVRLGAWGYPRRSPDEYALRLLATSLGSFGVGRLYREIRDERGLAYSAFAQVSPGPTTGLFTAGFDTRPEQVSEALDVALRILGEVGQGAPVTATELGTARDMATNAFAFRFDGVAKIAFERATFDLFDYPPDYLATWREKVAKVEPAEVVRVARGLEPLQIVIVGPVEKMGDLSRFGTVVTITDVEAFR